MFEKRFAIILRHDELDECDFFPSHKWYGSVFFVCGNIDTNHYVFIVVDGRSRGYSMGLTMTEFAEMFKELGCTDAYNLDGGGSSTMYFMGRVVNNPLGKNKERGTSDILFIAEK